jgi:hypothetical protein
VDIFRPVKTTGPPYELGLGENLWPETPGDFRAIAEKYIANLIFLATEVVRHLLWHLVLTRRSLPVGSRNLSGI